MRALTGTAIVAGLLAASVPQPATAAASVQIAVSQNRYVTNDGVPVGDIPAAMIGSNQRWPDDGKGVWNSAAGRPADTIVSLSRNAGLNMLRYPGGTVANLFDFAKAIGPAAQRGCQTSGGFANGQFSPTDSRFGPDENEKLADAIGGKTTVMVPTINRTAADAANYVEYMNSPADGAATNPNGGTDWAEVRAANGHPAPYGIRYWEYGNEPYHNDQIYWRSTDPAVRVRQFIEGGWQRQTAANAPYANNDGLFSGCDLATRKTGNGQPNQAYRVRFAPIALPGDAIGKPGVGDPILEPVLKVNGVAWKRVNVLTGQPANAQVYRITRADGGVHFGNGVNGAIPPAGATLSFEYVSGIHQGFLAYRDALKNVDPTIEVCSGWGQPRFIDAMGTRPYDCLGIHSYSSPPTDGTPTRYNNLQYATVNRDAELRDFRTRLAAKFPAAAARPDLVVTEYGTLIFPEPAYEARLAHVLYLGGQFAGQLENNVRLSINSNTADLPLDNGGYDPANMFGSPPQFVTTGRAALFSLYKSMVGSHVVTTAVTGNPQLTAPNGNYGALRVVSVCTANQNRLMVLNRDPANPVSATVTLTGRQATGSATVATLNAASVESYNAPGHLNDIAIQRSQVPTSAGTLTHTFPAHSATLIELTGTTPCGS
ncbi:alpha-L-arabinofuranosidase C-terminal domain-containing protein [Paractinoplanes lichenicola]|uniref:Alpha-L-arabinofuranosidase 1 catalytic domain-containing protein n=1 Tax=Paractinoplanes lichenicola TaxID=2802976 RepID=A0ABS1W0P5_9ACTN|nr:alpha-L-arabinofuranosidase C-terminal domain-containing protein [Actinoplanes lichenicola]MBL7260133.1 hypothetical protein [Actinoplanes lichenicola]